jgi:hypothetical protein
MSQDKPSITSVEQLADSLPAEEKALFHRLYAISVAGGGLKLPEGMQPWARKQFGSLTAITEQKIVRVTNRITLEETIFNPLRGLRPGEARQAGRLEERLKEAKKTDIFANPREMTPGDRQTLHHRQQRGQVRRPARPGNLQRVQPPQVLP